MDDKVFLKQFVVGPMGNYLYLIGDAQKKQVAVVDPAWDAAAILSVVKEAGMQVVCVLLTHGHYDHVNALNDLLISVDVPVYISELERELPDVGENLIKVTDHQKIMIGEIEIECISTPGHTPGSQCFKHQDILLTGDTLFINGCGRCDLPGGNANHMYNTLTNVIKPLSDSTMIYCGHQYGDKAFDTLGNQKKTNPYLLCNSRDDFLTNRMGL